MPNDFESYLKQLQQLEQSDNCSALYSFCTLNGPVLSYFKGIWGPLQSILQSSQVDTGIINEIKPILVHLSDIKDTYESLKSNASKDCKEEILQFQKQIDSITVSTYSSVAAKLKTLENKNRLALRTPSLPKKSPSTSAVKWADAKERILRGEMSSLEDIALAEEHVTEGATLSFFKSLASKTKKASVLNSIYVSAKRALSSGQWADMLWALVRSGVSYDRKEDAVLDLLYRTEDPNSLSELGRYCYTEKTRSVYNSKFKAVNKKAGGGRGAGKVLLIIVIIAAVIAIFFSMFV